MKPNLANLKQNDIVLGPSKDGGFYLMGLKKSHFNVETFLKLPWQTSALSRSISKAVQSQRIKLSYLEFLSDIDTLLDAKHNIDSFKKLSRAIKDNLISYISVEKEIISSYFISIENFSQTLLFNKGSPVLLHV